MTTYAIGDIQGCYEPFMRLLDKVDFDEKKDKLWSVGDLVNRGPQSLKVLEFCRSLGKNFTCALGNHDLHLLAVAACRRQVKTGDTFDDVLTSPNRDELLHWLRHQNYCTTIKTAMLLSSMPASPPNGPLTRRANSLTKLRMLSAMTIWRISTTTICMEIPRPSGLLT